MVLHGFFSYFSLIVLIVSEKKMNTQHFPAIIFLESWNDMNFIYSQLPSALQQSVIRNRYVPILGLANECALEEVVNFCHYNFIMFSLYRKIQWYCQNTCSLQILLLYWYLEGWFAFVRASVYCILFFIIAKCFLGITFWKMWSALLIWILFPCCNLNNYLLLIFLMI